MPQPQKLVYYIPILLTLICVCFFLFTALTATATTPQINYQGRLLSPSGTAVPNGTYTMSFALYTEATGSTPVWTETRTGNNEVTVRNGLFSVMLGEVNPVTAVNFNQPLYLGITIESDSEMSPRKVLGTVPAAFEADNLDGQDGSYYLDRQNATGTQTASTISDFATTSRSLLSSSATGITYSTATGDFSLTSGYTIPLTASTTAWQTFYTTPSSRITAGTGLAWDGNTINASSTYFDGQYFKQGGNSFATTATLGTNDSNDLIFETNNTERMRLLTNGNLAIGTTTATQRLTVDGNLDLQSDGAIYVNNKKWFVADTALNSTYIAEGAGRNNSGSNVILLGNLAGANNNRDSVNIIGFNAGINNTGEDTNILGTYAGINNKGADNNLIGRAAGSANTGFKNNIIGYSAGGSNAGNHNNLFGTGAGYNNAGAYNNFFGENAGHDNTGSNNNFLGYEAGRNSTSTSYNNFFGYRVGFNNTGSNNNLLGQSAGYSSSGNNNNLFGFLAGGSLSGSNNNILGYGAAADSTDGSNNNILGQNAGGFNSGSDNNILGQSAGSSNGGSYNNLFGWQAGFSNTGSYNNFLGFQSGSSNTGNFNNFLGMNAGFFLQATSSDIIGSQAFFGNNSPYQAVNNVALGYRTGYNAQTGASNNILLGYQAADNLTTGANNIVLGYDVDLPSATSSNQLVIGNLIYGTGIDGVGTNISSGSIGIGTQPRRFNGDPDTRSLSIAGTQTAEFNILNSGRSAGYTSDINFINNDTLVSRIRSSKSTTDALDGHLTFFTGDSGGILERMRITKDGNIGIGTPTPTNKLTVEGGTGLVASFSGRVQGANAVNNNEFVTLSQLSASSSLFTDGGTTTYLTQVGDSLAIGTTTATQRLTVDGNLDLQSGGSISINNQKWFAANTASSSTYIGEGAGSSDGGSYSTLIGRFAGSQNTGDDVVSIGSSAGTFNKGGTNTLIGRFAGYAFGGSRSNVIGSSAGRGATSTTAIDNNLIGTNTGYNNTGSYNNLLGQNAGYNNTGNDNNIFGRGAGSNNTGSNNNLFGFQAGINNTGFANNIIGSQAGQNNTGSHNNIIGRLAGVRNTGSSNTFIGFGAAYNLQATSSDIIGESAFRGAGETPYQAVNNVALGYRTGYNAQTGASNNILLGYQAADNLTTGANNIVLGYDVDLPSATSSNQLVIGNLIYGTGIDGTGTTVSSGNIGIGTNNPTDRLTVDGAISVNNSLRLRQWNSATDADIDALTNGTTGGGILESQLNAHMVVGIRDNDINDSFSIVSGGGNWDNDNTYDTSILTARADGNVGIGTNAPSSKLTVAGDIRLDDTHPTLYFKESDNTDLEWSAVASGRAFSIRLNNTAGFPFSIQEDKDVIFDGGNVGIGTNAPDTLLTVGSTAITDGTSLLKLQDANSNCVFTANSGGPACGSDKTLKKDISLIENELALITKLEPKFWRFKSENSNDPLKSGFIAQDVELVLPELVSENTWIDGTQRKFLNINGMIPYIVGAVKELYEMVESFAEEIRTKLITTDKLCITVENGGVECITGDELRDLRESNGQFNDTSSNEQTTETTETGDKESDNTTKDDATESTQNENRATTSNMTSGESDTATTTAKIDESNATSTQPTPQSTQTGEKKIATEDDSSAAETETNDSNTSVTDENKNVKKEESNTSETTSQQPESNTTAASTAP